MMATAALSISPDEQLAQEMLRCYEDPERFVRIAYPWGEPGTLQQYRGPDVWQQAFLRQLGEEVKKRGFDGRNPAPPIRMAVSSGHGIGKSTLVSWVVNWILSTRPYSQGTVSANTFAQLETKTWASIRRWTAMCITGHWFNVTGDRISYRNAPANWFCSSQTCKEENSEAFAGQHSAQSTSFYVFDEASAIPDKIFEVAEGGLTDGEPMMFMFGNPTRNSGKFHRSVFGLERDRWTTRTIDSRSCSMTNKALIDEWIRDYGEDSDFVRVRVLGLAPRAGDLQFIDTETVGQAMRRRPADLPDDPIICGVDVARGGKDNTVIRYRRGLNAAFKASRVIVGEACRDSMLLVSVLSEILNDQRPGHRVAMMFVDAAFGGPVVNRLHQLGFRDRVQEINFGSAAPDNHCANMRAYMWLKMRDWLPNGSIDSDMRLETDLCGPGYHHDKRDRLVLESKEDMEKRGLASPDHGDSLALTFARPVAPPRPKPRINYAPVSAWS